MGERHLQVVSCAVLDGGGTRWRARWKRREVEDERFRQDLSPGGQQRSSFATF
jgi:hypothetical protein